MPSFVETSEQPAKVSLSNPLTETLGIQHPILLAGMYMAGCPELAAAVSNAGGLGVIGAIHYTPQQLRESLADLKSRLRDPSLPFGVDLLLPKVGGTARRTNYDLTRGTLDEQIDIIIESGARLFVSAVGVPPQHVVERLHANGVLYMNMCGHPKHAVKACEAGADIICAQGLEAAGHISEIPTSVLVPACVDLIKNKRYTSPLTGRSVDVVAGGGICDGRGIAASFMYGASAVWVGTRFVTAIESASSDDAKQTIYDAGFDDTIRTTIFTGRPARTYASPYIREWESTRLEEQRAVMAKGIIPLHYDLKRYEELGGMPKDIEYEARFKPMSIASGLIRQSRQTAGEIVDEMVAQAVERLGKISSRFAI